MQVVLAVVLMVFFVVGGPGCRKQESGVASWLKTLEQCDYAESCADALKAVRALKGAQADSPAGIEARTVALKVGTCAFAYFPSAKRDFLGRAGLSEGAALGALRKDAAVLAGRDVVASGMDDASAVLDFLARPSCNGFDSISAIQDGGGPFSEPALMARMGTLAQMLASTDPRRAHLFGDVARSMLGCTLSRASSTSAVLVEARNVLYDLVNTCSSAKSSDRAFIGTCGEVKSMATQRSLALPLPDIGAGDLLSAMLPGANRGIGIAMTPPWAVVLTAGRLGIWDQPVLKPGDRKSVDVVVEPMMDLRKPHSVDDVFQAMRDAFEGREKVEWNGVEVAALVVDMSTSAKELFELLEGMLAESDAIPVLAASVRGKRAPTYIPLNYRLTRRMLLDLSGRRRAFAGESVLSAFMTPFSMKLSRGGEEVDADFGRDASREHDLRELYEAVKGMAGDGDPPSLRLILSPTVSTGLLVDVIQTLSVRIPDANLETAKHFKSAPVLRGAGGAYEFLLPVIVVRLEK